MEPLLGLPAFLLEPTWLYLVLIVVAWIVVLALFVPGTGVIEVTAAIGLLYGLGGLLAAGASWAGLLLVLAAFGLYAAAILRQLALARPASGPPLIPLGPLALALIATLLQVIGGLLIAGRLPGLAWWLVILLALGSLAVYRWMLLPAVSALRPPPQSGTEALIGATAEVRFAATDDRPASVFLNGELWQVASEETLAVGDTVEVVAREGMRLVVRRTARREQ
jgi:membrane-bound serine protease (ClpP class)